MSATSAREHSRPRHTIIARANGCDTISLGVSSRADVHLSQSCGRMFVTYHCPSPPLALHLASVASYAHAGDAHANVARLPLVFVRSLRTHRPSSNAPRRSAFVPSRLVAYGPRLTRPAPTRAPVGASPRARIHRTRAYVANDTRGRTRNPSTASTTGARPEGRFSLALARGITARRPRRARASAMTRRAPENYGTGGTDPRVDTGGARVTSHDSS